MDISLSKGIITQLQCIKDFIKLGYHCSIPYGDCARYDVIVDINNKLYRVQCKTSTWAKDTSEENVAFFFDMRTTTTNTKKTTRKLYTKDEIDFFYTFFEGQSYLIPILEVEGKNTFRIRYKYPSTGQTQNIHLAKDYELEKIVNSLIKEEVVE